MERAIRIPLPGDIVLVNRKPGVVALQSVIRFRAARFSHAVIAIDDEFYIDSLPRRGVGFGRWKRLDPRSPVRAYRYKSAHPVTPELFSRMSEPYRLGYNMAFAFKDHPLLKKRFANTFYCSEYVAEVLGRATIGAASKGAQPLVLPIDLEKLNRHPDWIDVTRIYQPLVDRRQQPVRKRGQHSPGTLFFQQCRLAAAMRKTQAKIDASAKTVDEINSMMKLGTE